MSSPSDEENKSEADVQEDSKVASSRAGKEGDDGEDGTYVGRTFSDDAMDDEQTGAEARAQQGGN
ncbi:MULTISPECIES: hypothetical protein [Mycobacteriaceae]|uniref:hypothetical protein n=1 Tax=Mycobacteriaceae TaxID=1762 RepID=UPI0007FF98C6|nr:MULTISPECIES: hypothetical protein [Mycobacteriaceae]MCK0174007.1 hypothetical protein [Mycolicibacterium sp. F2034L]OBB55735.1 hypothetical protein A5757_04400 [Mycobacterium sp. 852013-51886_SCH5428379]